MSIKLLPASVNPVDASEVSGVSTTLVRVSQRAMTVRAGQIGLVPSANAVAESLSTRRHAAHRIYGTPVEDSESDKTGRSDWEYLSGWDWGRSAENTAIAHYLSYAAGTAGWRGRLISLYA